MFNSHYNPASIQYIYLFTTAEVVNELLSWKKLSTNVADAKASWHALRWASLHAQLPTLAYCNLTRILL